eukprot:bmy_05998T0
MHVNTTQLGATVSSTSPSSTEIPGRLPAPFTPANVSPPTPNPNSDPVPSVSMVTSDLTLSALLTPDLACDYNPLGALEGGLCDAHTDETSGLLSGQYRCKVHVWGQRCDSSGLVTMA